MEKLFQFTSKWSNIDSGGGWKRRPEARRRRKLLCRRRHCHHRFMIEIQIIAPSVCISLALTNHNAGSSTVETTPATLSNDILFLEK